MIRTFGLNNGEAVRGFELNRTAEHNLQWYWVDFNQPTAAEMEMLRRHFDFHHLAIEDSIYSFNKPKLDYYEGYSFFILNALHGDTLDPAEISLYVGNNFIVSFHTENLLELDQAWERVTADQSYWDKGPAFITHQIFDKVVDRFFPAVNKIEDRLEGLSSREDKKPIRTLLDDVFEIRADLLKIRRIVSSMRDLLYRILNSERLPGFKEHKLYFSDIHDHLLKLAEMIESSREITSDLRDSYLSINANRMNTNMMVLTVITTIFIPLTFIAGIYGMNFENMPELKWEYGYFIILAVMTIIGMAMFWWFKRKGWFDW